MAKVIVLSDVEKASCNERWRSVLDEISDFVTHGLTLQPEQHCIKLDAKLDVNYQDEGERQYVKRTIEQFCADELRSSVNVTVRGERELIEVVCSQNRSANCKMKVVFGKTGTKIQPHTSGALHAHEVSECSLTSSKKLLRSRLAEQPDVYQDTFNTTTDCVKNGKPLGETVSKVRDVFAMHNFPCTSGTAIEGLIQPLRKPAAPEREAAELLQALEQHYPQRYRYKTFETTDGTFLLYAVWVTVEEHDMRLPMVVEWTIEEIFNANIERMNLLGCSARDGNDVVFPLAFALYAGNDEETLTSIMQDIKDLLPGLRPCVHKIEGEKAIQLSVQNIFGGWVRQCDLHARMAHVRRFAGASSEQSLTNVSPSEKVNLAEYKKICKAEVGAPDFAKFHAQFSVLCGSSCHETASAALPIFKGNCSKAEVDYLDRHVKLENHLEYQTWLHGSKNLTSDDMESTFSMLKAIPELREGKLLLSQTPALIKRWLPTWVSDEWEKVSLEAERRCKRFARDEAHEKRWPSNTLDFINSFTPGAQLSLFDSLRPRCARSLDLNDALASMKSLYGSLPSTAEILRRRNVSDADQVHKPAPTIGLELSIRWLEAPDLVKPHHIFVVETTYQLPEFVMVFDNGSFCTCGGPLRTGIPCAHETTLVNLQLAAMSLESVAVKYHVSEIPILWTCTERDVPILGNPLFVRDYLTAMQRLDILLDSGQTTIPLPLKIRTNVESATLSVASRIDAQSGAKLLEAAMENVGRLTSDKSMKRTAPEMEGTLEANAFDTADQDTIKIVPNKRSRC